LFLNDAIDEFEAANQVDEKLKGKGRLTVEELCLMQDKVRNNAQIVTDDSEKKRSTRRTSRKKRIQKGWHACLIRRTICRQARIDDRLFVQLDLSLKTEIAQNF